jgi:hypothetical protein
MKKKLKKTNGVEGSIFGKSLSESILKSLSRRFPGEPLKIIGRYMKTEIDVRIALTESDLQAGNWALARKEFSKISGMSLDEILDEKDMKALKEYLKKKNPERKIITQVYKNLRNRILFKI